MPSRIDYKNILKPKMNSTLLAYSKYISRSWIEYKLHLP